MRELAELGHVPDEMEELLELPGVGRYIASAVLCFGFGRDVPIVDVNVARVLGRVFGLKPKGRPQNDPNMLKLAGGWSREARDLSITRPCSTSPPWCAGPGRCARDARSENSADITCAKK